MVPTLGGKRVSARGAAWSSRSHVRRAIHTTCPRSRTIRRLYRLSRLFIRRPYTRLVVSYSLLFLPPPLLRSLVRSPFVPLRPVFLSAPPLACINFFPTKRPSGIYRLLFFFPRPLRSLLASHLTRTYAHTYALDLAPAPLPFASASFSFSFTFSTSSSVTTSANTS